MGIAVVTKDTSWFWHAGISGVVFLVSLACFLIEAPAVRCIGCGGTLLRAMRCAKHETAKRVFGSYTLHCTLVLASYSSSVHCPYCGMRYRISSSSREHKRREEQGDEERLRAEAAAKMEKAKKKAARKNVPYY